MTRAHVSRQVRSRSEDLERQAESGGWLAKLDDECMWLIVSRLGIRDIARLERVSKAFGAGQYVQEGNRYAPLGVPSV